MSAPPKILNAIIKSICVNVVNARLVIWVVNECECNSLMETNSGRQPFAIRTESEVLSARAATALFSNSLLDIVHTSVLMNTYSRDGFCPPHIGNLIIAFPSWNILPYLARHVFERQVLIR